MQNTPKGLRLHIGIFGRRNAGKSSVLNALVRQKVSIVSDVPGTTTDPVEKPMELLPLGPVLFIDTAGIDEQSELGRLRVDKTQQVIERTDLALLVVEAGRWDDYEQALLDQLRRRGVPVVIVLNKADLGRADRALVARLEPQAAACVEMVAAEGRGAAELREAILRAVPEEFLQSPPLLRDLVPPGELAVLVVPIDLEAPRGRLILPQVQAIRDLLDGDAYCIVVKQRDLPAALERLRREPALVVTDSQAFAEVAEATPPSVKLTSFSILLARQKGDLAQFVRGATAIGRLRPGASVLVAEACTHHPIGDDIGRVKIPRWLERRVGGPLRFDHVAGRDFPDDDALGRYELVIHCGACMWNRREVLARIERCRRNGVPVSNYGVTIAFALGMLGRALEPFPDALALYRAWESSTQAGG